MNHDSVTCPVHSNALQRPDAVALKSKTISLSYGALEERIIACAEKLTTAGVDKGDRIAVAANNSVGYAILIFASYRAGGTLVPLNVLMQRKQLMDLIKRSDCRLCLTDSNMRDLAAELKCEHALLEDFALERSSEQTSNQDSYPSPTLHSDMETTIVFTSGSRGIPKGVILTLGNHLSSAKASNQNIEFQPGDSWLATLPFYHVGGMGILFRSAISGGMVYIMERFDPSEADKLITSGAISHISVVPTMLQRLLELAPQTGYPDSLKAILLGGAAVPSRLLAKTKELSLPVLRTSGKPLTHCEVRVLDENGEDNNPKTEGEIAIRGGSVFKDYLGETDTTVFDADGWFRTGDIGFFDIDNSLTIVGRKDDMFISGGENVHPAEIERVASEFPGVKECCAIAVEDREWGHRPVLFVSFDETGTVTDDLRYFLESRLPAVSRPEKIIEVETIPRKSIDKPDKDMLFRIYRASLKN